MIYIQMCLEMLSPGFQTSQCPQCSCQDLLRDARCFPWILPERLQPPSAHNVITKLTLAGKRKVSQKTKGAVMEAGVDYELDMTAVMRFADLFPFPEDIQLFGKHIPETYQRFRQTWILRRRQRPVVPAPEVCPMPSRKASKQNRSKIYSVYLRPWSKACNESCWVFGIIWWSRFFVKNVWCFKNLHLVHSHQGVVTKV